MIAAVSFVVVLSVLAVCQVALACGAPCGAFAWGGGRRVLPARLRIASGMSPLLYAASRSKPERYVMTPVSLALTVTSLLVALG
ncbi:MULTISPECIES: hypothetical protein [unclassified Nocardia]|uniref:hypothetical protein n=1 Tax=unclassified Nocardia TaxID=2637762 RepID=UPI0024A81894|nr:MULTISPECIES: hypothetical protein [unclassified Nocardia]